MTFTGAVAMATASSSRRTLLLRLRLLLRLLLRWLMSEFFAETLNWQERRAVSLSQP